MATVYLARDLKHDREVAIKVLREYLSASLGRERFLREIRVAAALQHPHILPLYDSGEADGQLFYVMPYVNGLSLREKLDKERELPIADAVRILRDVADALSEAHKPEARLLYINAGISSRSRCGRSGAARATSRRRNRCAHR